MIEITINGIKTEVLEDTKILEVAKKLGIKIPTLCHHDALPPDGNCRVCQVEVYDRERGKGKLAIACMYPIRKPVDIFTDNEKVRDARKSVIKLHLNRCPQAKVIQELAEEYGVEPLDERFIEEHDDICIRCGRCVRACEALGNNCLSFSGRGWNREIVPPFNEPPEGCLGCAACAEVCPTGAIKVTEEEGFREIWGRKFRLAKCSRCNEYYATEEYLKKLDPDEVIDINLCPRCKKAEEARRIGELVK